MRGLAQMNVADDFECESFEGGDSWGMIRQEQNPPQSQVVKDLRANSVISI